MQNTVRIIAGKWRSRRIVVTPVTGLRPTPDRLRETLFNWLQPVIAGARCLDLFAGTGALGFEAVSRGAAAATLVENNPILFKQLQDQCIKFDAENITVVKADVFSWLTRNATTFDITFLDPPFYKGLVEPSCRALLEQHTLAKQGLVYVESEPGLQFAPLWEIKKQSKTARVQYSLLQTRNRIIKDACV